MTFDERSGRTVSVSMPAGDCDRQSKSGNINTISYNHIDQESESVSKSLNSCQEQFGLERG